MAFLIVENIDNFSTLVESKPEGGKDFFIEGIFLQADIANKNGRKYPMSIMEKEVDRYIREEVKANKAYGELDHPDGPKINPDRISHRIVSLHREGSNFIGKAKVNNNPMGKIVQGLLEDGGALGVSSRGLGSLKHVDGIMEVQSDFKMVTAADVVINPSAPQAFINGIMEGVNYIFDPISGTWLEEKVNDVKDKLKEMTKEEREARALSLMEDFFLKLSKLTK
jgi:hypothetical protein